MYFALCACWLMVLVEPGLWVFCSPSMTVHIKSLTSIAKWWILSNYNANQHFSFIGHCFIPTLLNPLALVSLQENKLKRINKCFFISPFLLYPIRTQTKYIICTWHGNFTFQEEFWLNFENCMLLEQDKNLFYLVTISLVILPSHIWLWGLISCCSCWYFIYLIWLWFIKKNSSDIFY